MPSKESKREKAKEVVDILEEISILLVHSNVYLITSNPDFFKDTDLDRAQLSLCVSLIENGVNPEALAVSVVNFAIMMPLKSSEERDQRASTRARR